MVCGSNEPIFLSSMARNAVSILYAVLICVNYLYRFWKFEIRDFLGYVQHVFFVEMLCHILWSIVVFSENLDQTLNFQPSTV